MPSPASSTDQPAWTDPLLANPHAVSDKAARVNKMFAAIAPSYDLNNRLHSLWMDQHWRNIAVKMASVQPGDAIFDIACGTGDLTLKFAKALHRAQEKAAPIQPSAFSLQTSGAVTGIDFTAEMLPIARAKASRFFPEIKNQKSKIKNPPAASPRRRVPVSFQQGDAMALALPDQSADILSIAFGIRNVSDWGKAIDEFFRVLKSGGRLVILEFSLPANPLLRAFYNFYFRKIMPITATLISGDKTGAYKYLPESVNTFISRDTMQSRMQAAGFSEITARPLTFGICVCYRGFKK